MMVLALQSIVVGVLVASLTVNPHLGVFAFPVRREVLVHLKQEVLEGIVGEQCCSGQEAYQRSCSID